MNKVVTVITSIAAVGVSAAIGAFLHDKLSRPVSSTSNRPTNNYNTIELPSISIYEVREELVKDISKSIVEKNPDMIENISKALIDANYSESIKNKAEWYLVRPIFESILSDETFKESIDNLKKNLLNHNTIDKLTSGIADALETYKASDSTIEWQLIRPMIEDEEIIEKLKTYLVSNINPEIFTAKVLEAISSWKPSLVNSYKYNDIISDVCESTIASIEFTDEESEVIRNTFKQNLSEIISKTALTNNAERIVRQAVSGEVYKALKTDPAFLNAIDIETGTVRDETIMFSEYDKIWSEMSSSKDIIDFAFLFKRNIDKPYQIIIVTKKNNNAVITRKASICKSGVSKYRESEITNSSFNDYVNNKLKSGYTLLTHKDAEERMYRIAMSLREKNVPKENDT